MTASVDDLLKSASTSWKKKDAGGAVRALEEALLVARKDAPLEVRQACAINHDHTGIGLFTPAKNDVIAGRRVRVYVEVANFALTSVGEGVGHAQLDVTGDFTFEDPALPKDAAGNAGFTKLTQGVGLGSQAFDTRTPLGVTSFGVDI